MNSTAKSFTDDLGTRHRFNNTICFVCKSSFNPTESLEEGERTVDEEESLEIEAETQETEDSEEERQSIQEEEQTSQNDKEKIKDLENQVKELKLKIELMESFYQNNIPSLVAEIVKQLKE